ncbi:coxsackievirus and adenovirus receptor homolog [Anabas testudineus]|uniref:coxsackievirus and adenovirus receptor homolog n=1 Tax=Anabas testudineus TaxID=64144 RepID=UPI000E4609A7|nr:coxsackievirus and adenovirus receptor homolog [Anabas testudineus]
MAATTSDSLCYALILSSCFLVSAAVETIIANPGQSVILPCQIQVSEKTAVKAIEWTRPDLEEEYVLFYRDGQLDTDHQYPTFKNRVELKEEQVKDGDLSLNLKNVRISDTGTYECRVVQRRTNHRKRSILESDPINTTNLTVVEPDVKNITAKPGDTVILPCNVTRNTNIRVVEWSRDNKTLCFNRNPEINDLCRIDVDLLSFKDRVQLNHAWMAEGNMSLILKNVTIRDSGRYECRVDQSGTKHTKRQVRVEGPCISIVYLTLSDSGYKKAGGDKNTNPGVGVAVGVGVAFAFAVGAAALWLFYKNIKGQKHIPHSVTAGVHIYSPADVQPLPQGDQ